MIGQLKAFLRNNAFSKHLYFKIRDAKNEFISTSDIYKRILVLKKRYIYNRNTSVSATFENRLKGREKACIVLAGYKEFFYPAFFGRLSKYAPDDLDIIIMSSGTYSTMLSSICKEHGWSYFSTKINNVALIQNAVISKLVDAKYIFKLDEDILITENYFEKMIRAYEHSKNESEFLPGIMAPLIPINGYGHMRILEKLNLKDVYANKFEKPMYAAGNSRKIENNPEVAKFFWGEGNYIPSIDQLNQVLGKAPLEEKPCPIRFSIGAIMFERDFFEEFGYFSNINRNSSQLGADEHQLNDYCYNFSRPIMVSENIVVGHLSFGLQNQEMKAYFEAHPDVFM